MPEPKPEVPERIWITPNGGRHTIYNHSTGKSAFYATGYWTAAPQPDRLAYVPAASLDAAVREALEAAANVARALDGQGLRLHCGEMTAQEARTARAVVGFMERRIRALIPGGPA